MRPDVRHLVTDTTLSFNQCIDCGQETSIYQYLRAIMEKITCLNTSRNRLDKYHFLTKRWVDRVIVTVSGKETHAKLKNILSMISSFLFTQKVRVK